MWHHVTASWTQDVILQKRVLLFSFQGILQRYGKVNKHRNRLVCGSYEERPSSLSTPGAVTVQHIRSDRQGNERESLYQATHQSIRSNFELAAGVVRRSQAPLLNFRLEVS